VEKMTGLSRAQTTRLISRYLREEPVRLKAMRRHRFASRYGLADISLLAAVDGAHEVLSGPATQKITYPFMDALLGRRSKSNSGPIPVAINQEVGHCGVTN
jgi:hypothetical protein